MQSNAVLISDWSVVSTPGLSLVETDPPPQVTARIMKHGLVTDERHSGGWADGNYRGGDTPGILRGSLNYTFHTAHFTRSNQLY